ncbi:hypothetical protein B0G80_3504 [Paraburkholderia sp. BL6669N2]|nr:hypothetical protein B0G80_3504 [Paraburkholderia sp. BL6669N2]
MQASPVFGAPKQSGVVRVMWHLANKKMALLSGPYVSAA